ncbi:MAG: primosomal protein N' [Gemmatimonadota bacterium]|jgi:primosomal protein N' (replication factor Y)
MLVEVALPRPIPRTFTYSVEADVAEGTRVLVPFGPRRLIGWVVARTDRPPDAAIRPVRSVLDDGVPPALLRLCRWIADYYVAPLGVVLRSALPNALVDTKRPQAPVRTRRVLVLTDELPSLRQRDDVFARAHRQRALFELLQSMGGRAEVAHLTNRLNFSHSVLRGLEAKGLARFDDEEQVRDPFAGAAVRPGPLPPLTPAQATAVRALAEAAGAPARSRERSAPFLLHGVTGSGKTRVYIELLKTVVAGQGRGAIVLVPEIALTPQTVARFQGSFGDDVAVLHSGLSDGERYDAWRGLRDGRKRIVVGARSAIFAPLPSLGAIVVDEEHESSYKQSEAPRYHAREVAVMRARLEAAVCVLGSATPSLESWHNTNIDKYRLLELPERIEGRPLPEVRIVDLRVKDGARRKPEASGGRPPGDAAAVWSTEAERPAAGALRSPGRVLSPMLAEAVQDRLKRNEQTILLLNRRGYATFVQCRSCGNVWQCEHCNVSLTFHRGRRRLVCHYCFHEEPAPTHCERCGSGDLSFRGLGTEQVERSVAETFPEARIARMDIDTTSGKWAHHEILGRVERGEVDILLGTQMIAKGLDFPRVTLVGVVNADVGLNLPDFRASERTFQLLTQVAGRAGRGDLGGHVIIQTAVPGHYAVRHAVAHDYVAFAERELRERQSPTYPPHTRLANVVLSGLEEEAVQEVAASTAANVAAEVSRRRAPVELVGPAPCVIDRIRKRWRWHFLLRSGNTRALGVACHWIQQTQTPGGRGDLRIIIDRDPVTLL